MKKALFIGFSFLSTLHLSAQQVINFESFNVPADTFFNNAPQGYFEEDQFRFSNDYNASFDFNSGFSISTVLDTLTADYTNSHGAITGFGRQSATYAMMYGYGFIDCAPSRFPTSVYITNSTYAYFSMKNGDAFSKQFGSTMNAGGNIDGTNGEDFFRILFEAVDANNVVLDTVIFYLADYRFPNSSQDYIVKDWRFVDLSALYMQGLPARINFYYESSDNHPTFGMNTPAYFAMDDLNYDYTVGLSENSLALISFPNPVNDILNVMGEYEFLEVYEASGKKVLEIRDAKNPRISFLNFDSGIYFLKGSKNGLPVSGKVQK